MTRWNQLIAHPNFERASKILYNESLPICVRYACAEWLEQQIELDSVRIQLHGHMDVQAIIQVARDFFYNLLVQLAAQHVKYMHEESATQRNLKAAFHMYSKLADDPLLMYNQIREILQWEVLYLRHYEGGIQKHADFDTEALGITEKVDALLEQAVLNRETYNKLSTKIIEYNQFELHEKSPANSPDDDTTMCQHVSDHLGFPVGQSGCEGDGKRQEEHMNETSDTSRIVQHAQTPIEIMELDESTDPEEEVVEQQCAKPDEDIVNKLDLMQGISDVANELWLNIDQVISEMSRIERLITECRLPLNTKSQKFTALGAPVDVDAFNEIRVWMERLVFLSWMNYYTLNSTCQTIQSFDLPKLAPTFFGLLETIIAFWKRLVRAGFVVQKQPPHVVKTNTRFDAVVKLLAVNIIDGKAPATEVHVSLISADQMETPLSSIPKSTEIMNSTAKFFIDERQLTCKFANLNLKKIRPQDCPKINNGDLVKYALLFRTTVRFLDVYSFEVSCKSIPFIMITNRRIDAYANATSIWLNSFNELHNPFFVPPFVTWQKITLVINACFKYQTRRALSEHSLDYLCEQLFKHKIHYVPTRALVTWPMFSRDNLTGRQFTFWDLIFKALRLAGEQMPKIWQSGLILGFAGEEEVKARLLRCCPGTFLLRFSEKTLGALVISFVREGHEASVLIVDNVEITDELNSAELAEFVRSRPEWVHLYPNIPKDQAFGEFYTKIQVEPRREHRLQPPLMLVNPLLTGHPLQIHPYEVAPPTYSNQQSGVVPTTYQYQTQPFVFAHPTYQSQPFAVVQPTFPTQQFALLQPTYQIQQFELLQPTYQIQQYEIAQSIYHRIPAGPQIGQFTHGMPQIEDPQPFNDDFVSGLKEQVQCLLVQSGSGPISKELMPPPMSMSFHHNSENNPNLINFKIEPGDFDWVWQQ